MKTEYSYIRDILEQIDDIEEFLFEVTQEEFYSRKLEQKAVTRSFEIIGEATKKVGPNLRLKYTQVPWKKMAAFRDVLIHDYDRIAVEIIWDTYQEELPKLKSDLLQILQEET